MGRGCRSWAPARGIAAPSGAASAEAVNDASGVRAEAAGADGGAHPSQVGPQQLLHAPPGIPECEGAR